MSEKILVVGADGLIGRSLVNIFEESRFEVWKTSRRCNKNQGRQLSLDLSLDPTNWSLPPVAFSRAVICAAVTSIEQCKMEPEKSAQTNVVGTLNLANYLMSKNTFIVFVSSNQVFDGTFPYAKSTDPTAPQTEYGRQKVKTENELLNSGENVAVVRFSKIISPDMPLIKSWIHDLSLGKVIHPFSDMKMSPIPLSFASRVLHYVAEKRISGITQVSAVKDVSYESVALYIARRLGVDSNLIEPISYRETRQGYTPVHTTLNISRIQKDFEISPPDVWQTIDNFFL